MKKLIEITFFSIIILTLCACSNNQNNKEVPKDIKTIKGEIKLIDESELYLSSKDKTYGSTDFVFDKNDDIQEFQRGDLVEITYYEEKRVDQTGKKFSINHIETIKDTDIDNMYKEKYKISDLIPFEVNEITYSIIDPYKDECLEYNEIKGKEVKELLKQLNQIPIYTDANLDPYIGGNVHKIQFIGLNNEICTVNDHGEIRISFEDNEIICGYHFIGYDNTTLSSILDNYLKK